MRSVTPCGGLSPSFVWTPELCFASLRQTLAARYCLFEGAGSGAVDNVLPDLALIRLTSVALIAPFNVTSVRKFCSVVVWPEFAFVSPTSLAFTLPLLVVSPRSTPIGMAISDMRMPSLTPVRLIVTVWPSGTPVRLTTMLLPLV